MTDIPVGTFTSLQQDSACLFATRARLEAAPVFDGTDAFTAGRAAAPALVDFAWRAQAEELDGLVLELTYRPLGADLDTLAVTVRQVISGLLDAIGTDPGTALRDAGTPGWWLTLAGTRWFVVVFAPCYPSTSPRSTHGLTSTFLLLQPVHSFDRHASPKGSVIAPVVRQRIRDAHTVAGCPYDPALAQQDIEALKFIAPLHQDDPPVTWWQPGLHCPETA
ncbi:hypothetical protein OG871_27525 [Kitasatospora sp. NBC_00374]|uniref:hypothetical protein n=1 Tax=Kitasatospora sp. NBC_00374 TaxID=2975964 RepID=UPI0030E28AD5